MLGLIFFHKCTNTLSIPFGFVQGSPYPHSQLVLWKHEKILVHQRLPMYMKQVYTHFEASGERQKYLISSKRMVG